MPKGRETGFARFPEAGIDGFLSHFVIAIEFQDNGRESPAPAGRLIHLSLPSAVQTVARSAPFRYEPRAGDHPVDLAVPHTSRLKSRVRRSASSGPRSAAS